MKLRSSLVGTALALSAVPVVLGPAPLACAGPGLDATLVVDTGGAEYRYCIALDAERVTGLHLIELANEQHGLSYSLGYQGQAVCMLAGVGSDEEECFHGGEPFWGYWRGDGAGGWTWSGTGAGGTRVEDGDVEGWSWGEGNDGNSHQQPPATTHESVCGAEEPPPKKGGGNEGGGGPDPDPKKKNGKHEQGGSGGSNGNDGEGTSEGPGDDTSDDESSDPVVTDDTNDPKDGSKDEKGDTPAREKRKAKKKQKAAKPEPSPLSTLTPLPSATPSTAPASSSGGGPPASGIAGLLVAIALGAGGAWFVKRRHLAQS